MYTLLTGLWRQWTACNQYNILILGRQRTGKSTLFHTLKRLTPLAIEDSLSSAGGAGFSHSTNPNIPTPQQALRPVPDVSPQFIQALESSLGLTRYYAPTIGLNSNKALVESGLEFQFWDLGGQAKLRPMWPHYYLETHAIIYVHDYDGDGDGYADARDELYKLMSLDALQGVPIAIVLTRCPPTPSTDQDALERGDQIHHGHVPTFGNNSSLHSGQFASGAVQPNIPQNTHNAHNTHKFSSSVQANAQDTHPNDGLTPHPHATWETTGTEGNVNYRVNPTPPQTPNRTNHSLTTATTITPTPNHNSITSHHSIPKALQQSFWHRIGNNNSDDNIYTNPAETHPWMDFHGVSVRLGIYHILSHFQRDLFLHHPLNDLNDDNNSACIYESIGVPSGSIPAQRHAVNDLSIGSDTGPMVTTPSTSVAGLSNGDLFGLEEADISIDPYITSFGLLNTPSINPTLAPPAQSFQTQQHPRPRLVSPTNSTNSIESNYHTTRLNQGRNNSNITSSPQASNTNTNLNAIQSFLHDPAAALQSTSLAPFISAITDHPRASTRDNDPAQLSRAPTFLPLEQNTHSIRLFVINEYPAGYVSTTTSTQAPKGSIQAPKGNPKSLAPHVNQIAQLIQWLIETVSASDRAGIMLTG